MSTFTIWVGFHVLVCFGLIIVVLMQSAKGEGLAGGTAFGGGVSGAVFGGRGAASFLSKATTALAVVFMINCGGLAWLSADSRSVAQGGAAATSSAVTREAASQLLQNQAAQPFDTSSTIQVLPGEAVDEGSGDSAAGDAGGN